MYLNKFKIVVPSYNNEKWLEPNLASIIHQNYTNYEVLYIDDASTDDTYDIVQHVVHDLPNWKVIRNEKNMRRGFNISPYSEHIKNFITNDEDILVFVDGDDWLYDDEVLEKLNKFYNTGNYWMTYGGMVCYPSGQPGNPQNSPYPDQVHQANAYRRDHWRASHLRTFKWHLYKQIKEEDLRYNKTGEYYFHAEDLATSFPCLEMCPQNRIGVLDFYSYVFNETPSNRERGVAREAEAGMDLENEIRNKTPYQTINKEMYITNIMSGGLGNMMFQVAAAYARGRTYRHRLVFNPEHIGTLHRPPTVYKDNVFRNIPLLEEPSNFAKVSEESYRYNPLPVVEGNMYLDGYFQSYKYFNNCQPEVIDLFKAPEELIEKLKSKYPTVGEANVVSMHVRRGNYTNLSDHHHNLSIGYYKNAISYFKGSKFLVFSDDIEWCKENFIGEEFTFVEGNEDYEDLYLMSLCQHQIIANSTFSWWGALLNRKPNRVVIYPDKWFGPANAENKTWDLFPEDWICLTEDYPKLTINLFDNAFGHLAKPNGRYSSVHDKIAANIDFVRDQDPYDGITVFTDYRVGTNNVQSKYKIGWLIETREVTSFGYDSFERYKDGYDFVMTHDQELLDKYPDKAKFTIFGGSWIKTNNYGLHPKTKGISMIYSDKRLFTGHKLRHEIANGLTGVDFYGGAAKAVRYKEEALLDYRYSIVIENSKTPNYFTEKLVDAMIVGTIPIYWGAPNIGDFFDVRGMIIIDGPEGIQNIVDSLNEETYLSKIEYIKNNIELAKKYAVTEDWMYENIFKDLK